MNTKNIWKIERFDSILSTNEYIKTKRNDGENLLVIARAQTGGKGTKGRSFSSQKGGLYLSALTHYNNLLAKESFRIMQASAVAVCKTLAEFGLQPKIKWPNDIFVGGKKICGILIENTFSGNQVSSSVVGIGLNICNSLPNDLLSIATTMQLQGVNCTVEAVEKVLIENLSKTGMEKEYPTYLGFVGEEVILLVGEEKITAVVRGVDEQGNLIAETNEGERKFPSAEISLRLKGGEK